MPRTPSMHHLQQVAAAAAADAGGTTRRQLLRRAGTVGALMSASALTPRWLPEANAATAPRIAVVGAGLAGLTAAYRLKQAGYAATVYEASDRIGGRCWTIRDAFADGQIAEHGGELIDQNHTEIRRLAQELGLTLDNLLAAQANGVEDTLYFDGEPYPFDQATRDLKGIWQQIHSDVSAAGYPTTYDSSTQRGRELDAMSIADWVAAYVPGGRSSKLGQFLEDAYVIEYGADATDQSALNMLYLLGYSGQGNLRIFGPSNEKYHVHGGNDQIPQLLAAQLGGQIRLGAELTGVTRNADGTHTLAIQQGSKTSSVVADHCVLALPFSTLRSADLSGSGFDAVKLRAIRELGMGANCKLHLQFSRRFWSALGSSGETYADTGYQNTWEVTRAQPGTSGVLVGYSGGTPARSYSGDAQTLARRFLGQLEPVLPGATAAWNGRATIDDWPDYRWTKGAYSYWRVGQYTAIAGAEREASGTCHFAGEHTSLDFQGYLNGGVESGERAASEILAALK